MLKAQKKQTNGKTFLQKKLSRNKHQVWEKARKGGRILRKKHQQDEKEQKALEVEELENAYLRKQRKEERAAKRKEKAMRAPSTAQTAAKRIVCVARKRLAHPQHSSSSSLSSHHASSSSSHLAPSDAEEDQPIPLSTPAVHDWVGVAYDNGWYPGHVSIHDADIYVVSFLHPTSLANNFRYPPRKDEVAVTMPFIFACPLDPPRPTSGGRMFILPQSGRLVQQYNQFKAR